MHHRRDLGHAFGMLDPVTNRDCDGDTDDANTRLFREEGSWLARFFRGRVRSTDDITDLVQETMLRFLRAQQASTIDAPQHYLRRTAANLLIKHETRGSTRIARASVDMIEDIHGSISIDPQRELESREELEYWDNVLSLLKPKTREIFLLSRVEGYSYKEIAAEYGMTVWGVNKHMSKAIAHIDSYRRDL